MFVELVIGPRPEVFELGKDKRNSFGLQDGISIGQLKMKMRSGRLARVSKACDDGSAGNMIVQANFYASGLQMGIRYVAVGGDAKDDVVAHDVIQSHFLG